MMHFTNAALLCLVSILVILEPEVDAVKLCGHELPEMLTTVCLNGFNTKLKRSNVPMAYNGIDKDDDAYSNLDFENEPLLRALLGEGGSHLMNTRRRRYGVSDECCKKSCTFRELSYYCL